MRRNRDRRGWNPWTTLRESPDVEFALAPLPDAVGGGYYFRCDDWAGIAIDRRLSARDRNAALAHELVHHERGGGISTTGMPPQWQELAKREDHRVDDEVARRLVPLDDLAALVELAELNDLPVDVWRVADEFDVPEPIAARALRLLVEQRWSGCRHQGGDQH